MKKLGKAFLFLLAVMVLLTAISRAAASFTVAQVRVEQPQARKIVHTVNGSGIVEKMEERPIYAPAGILVKKIKVQEGQQCKKGDVLARLDMDSIEEKITALSDEIKELELRNQALAAQQQKQESDRKKENERAQEDYDNLVALGKAQEQEAENQVEDAKQKLRDAKKEAKEQAQTVYEEKLAALQEERDAAKKAYEAALEQEKNAVLQAKRALEDAFDTPAEDYDLEIARLEISQKQQKLNDLYKQKWQGIEGIDEQISALQNEIVILQLQLKEKENAAAKEGQERVQAIARAQEDYDNVVETCGKLVDDAKGKWDDAEYELNEFLKSDVEDISKDASVKAAKEALEAAKRQQEELKRQQEEKELQAKRLLEDSSQQAAADNTAAINRITMEEKERQLALLMDAKERGGKIVAPADGTVTQIQLAVGQKTAETASFLMTDASGGMSFTAQISKEDAVYVMAGDKVTLKSLNQTYEDFEVLSVETNEDETVKVTVYVPGDTFALGTHVSMVLNRQSEEYSITVPVAAVHTENEKNYVYVMEPEDSVLGGQYAAVRMDVTVAEKNGLYAALVDSSLTEESQVITDCDQMISAGERIRLLEE